MSFIEKFSANEHGNHSSMLLIGERLIFFANNLVIAFEKKTGKELWRSTGGDGDYTDGISVPKTFKFDGEDAIFRAYTHANILRVSDGKVLAPVTRLYFIWSTPLIENGVAYWGDREGGRLLLAQKLPSKTGEAAKPLFTVNAPKEVKDTKVVASPLLQDGLIYIISEGGFMSVVDAQTGTEAYTASPFTTDVKWVVKPGVCASPTLAGGHVYLMSDTGVAVVLQSGRAYKALATNVLEEKPANGYNFLNSPVFEGACMYYRSGNYLYCVNEK